MRHFVFNHGWEVSGKHVKENKSSNSERQAYQRRRRFGRRPSRRTYLTFRWGTPYRYRYRYLPSANSRSTDNSSLALTLVLLRGTPRQNTCTKLPTSCHDSALSNPDSEDWLPCSSMVMTLSSQ